jgi:uncharacterized membrane protein
LLGIIGLIIDVIIYYTAKDKYAKFHAAQACFLVVAVTVIGLILSFGVAFLGMGSAMGMMGSVAFIGAFGILVIALNVILAIFAFLGKDFKIPVISKIIDK